MINICDRYLAMNQKAKKLPLIYPMIFYNGKRKYNVEKNLWRLFEDPLRAKDFWVEDHNVINVHEIPDEEFLMRTCSGFMEFSMKHIRNPNLLEQWRKMAYLLPHIKVEVGSSYIKMMVHYALTTMPEDDKMEFKKLIKDSLEEGEEIMASVAQNLWSGGYQDGHQQGHQQGRQDEKYEVAISLLSQGVSVEAIAIATKLPISELIVMHKRRGSGS